MPGGLGPYSLLGRLGEGGMGVVFLARDASGQTVALKVLRSVVAEDPMARRRLAREVETMRRVRSPYVAEVIDADLTGDTPYIVTRYVPGRTLDQVVSEGGPLPPSALLRLASGLADALAAVHAAGVVHRDLKPGNVMLIGELPVVIDFGIAQGPDATRLTMTGMFMGTPGFLAPEVIEGQASSEASDIHAWGATVAFAATGHPPFGSGAYETIFYRIVNGQPDLTGAPSSLLPLLKAALSRDPALRPPAVEVSARAAALDPRGLAPAAFPGADGLGSTINAAPATSGDQAPGRSPAANGAAGLAGAAGPASGAGLAGAAGVAPGLADPAAGRAGLNGSAAAGPGTIRPATAPFKVGRPSPADYADVLPPVQYGPGLTRPPKPAPKPRPVEPPRKNPFAPSAPAARKSRWPSSCCCGLAIWSGSGPCCGVRRAAPGPVTRPYWPPFPPGTCCGRSCPACCSRRSRWWPPWWWAGWRSPCRLVIIFPARSRPGPGRSSPSTGSARDRLGRGASSTRSTPRWPPAGPCRPWRWPG